MPTVNDTVKTNGTVQNGSTAETVTFSPEPQEKSADGETEYMAQVGELFDLLGPKARARELTNWGGWWRNRFREAPSKATRVLAEVRGMLREGRIRRSPGAAALDLWKRFPS